MYFGTDYSKFDTYDLVGKNVISVIAPDNAAAVSRQILQTTCKQLAIDSIVAGHQREGTEVMGVHKGGVPGMHGSAPDWSMQQNQMSRSDFIKLQNDKRDGLIPTDLSADEHFNGHLFFTTLDTLRDFLLDQAATSTVVNDALSNLMGLSSSTKERVDFTDWTTLFKRFHCEQYISEWEAGTTKYSLGHTLQHGEEVQSTQTLMTEGLAALPSGTVFITDRQTNGKGRGSNTWSGQKGCLMTTFSITIHTAEMLPFVQYMVCWAFVRAVRDIEPELDIRIKWPNDVYIGGKKVFGVLCQSTMSMNHNQGRPSFLVYAGFGANVTGDGEFETINNAICKLRKVDKIHITREELLARYIHTLSMALPVFEQFGFTPFQKEYCEYWLHQNEVVTVEGKDGSYTVTGISPSGFLKADNDTESLELHPDGNSFDMKQKFIAVKRLQK